MYDYDTIYQKFKEVNCTILTSKEEHSRNIGSFPKVKYIASCGHEHIVFVHSFLSRKSCIICPPCKHIINADKKKIAIKDDKLKMMRIELDCMNYFKEIISSHFEVIKAFDGCKADLIVKPKEITTDLYIGVQVKTCAKRLLDYGFRIMQKNYENYLILCVCLEDKKMWLIPFSIVEGLKKLSIGKKSKYNIYEVTKENVIDKMKEYYESMNKFTFKSLDTPPQKYTRREQEFYRYRESKLPFISFTYNEMEGLVYDFKIGEKRVQEKVGGFNINKNMYHFTLHKNNGKSENKKRQYTYYNEGDNDLYWLNCENKRDFYVIPENILIENKIVGKRKYLMINIKTTSYNEWLQPYHFDYENIDKERLLKLI